jgi:lipopolysaccharide export system permease protein
MLFDTTLRRELARTFSATLVVILTIVLTIMLMRAVRQTATGVVAPQDLVMFMGFTTLGYLATILALTLFVSVVTTLGRMYRDSEMTIWFASGTALTRFVRPILRMAWPVLLIIATLALVVWPWSNERLSEMQDRYRQRSDISRVTPGVFQTSRDGSGVLFVERTMDSNSGLPQARNVFVVQQRATKEAVVSARAGRIETRQDDRWLVLEDGQRTDMDSATGQRTTASFDVLESLAPESAARRAQRASPKALSTIDLMLDTNAVNQGELTWRFGLVFGALNLLLLAVGLSARNPRKPSNWNLLFALLAFVVYYNLITLGQAWVAGGRVSMTSSLALTHGVVFLLSVLLLVWRNWGTVLRLRPVHRPSANESPGPNAA